MNKLIFFLITLLCVNVIQSQVTQQWDKTQSGGCNDVAIDQAGNIYTCGSKRNNDNSQDFITIKYNSAGYVIWQRPLSETDSCCVNEIARSLEIDGSGNVIVTGFVWRSRRYNYSYITVKYDSAGVEQWRQYYNYKHEGKDFATSLAIDKDGNIFVTGNSEGDDSDYDYATIKYAPDGTELWVQRYDGLGHGADIPISLAVDSLGNVIVTGRSFGNGTDYDYATIKYWSSGNLAWVKRYNGLASGYDNAEAIDVDAAGNVYVTGSSEGNDYSDITTVKYSPMGVTNWLKKYDRPGSSAEWGKDVKVDGLGNVFVMGHSHFSNFTNDLHDIVTLKYNSSGVQQWVRIYNSPDNSTDIGTCMAIDPSSNIYITGYTSSSASTNDWDIITIKYSSSGYKKWEIKYNGPADYQDNGDAIAVRGSVVVVGGDSRGSDYKFNLATIKYTQSNFQLSAAEKITAVIFEVNNLVRWGNLSQGNGNALNVKLNAALQKVNQGNNNSAINQLGAFNNQVEALVRTNRLVPEYGETLTAEALDIIQDLSRRLSVQVEQPSSFALAQNYPNPFNPSTTIRFDIPKSGYVTLKVYDILGNEAASLVNETLTANSYEIKWDAVNYPSGVYFYRLTAENYTETRKMMLIK